MKKRSSRVLWIVLVVVLLAAVAGLGWWLVTSWMNPQMPQQYVPEDYEAEEMNETAEETEDVKAARTVCGEFLEAYAHHDGETAVQLTDEFDAQAFDFKGVQGMLCPDMDYVLGHAEAVSDEQVKVKVTITNVDLKEVLTQLEAKGEFGMDELRQTLEQSECPSREYEAEVYMVRTEDGWRVQLNGALSDALLGGYLSILEEAQGGDQ